MTCKKCNGNCGCEEEAITLPEYTKDKKKPDACSEVFNTACIQHAQPEVSILIGESEFKIAQGERLDSVIQKLLIHLSDKEDADTVAYNFKVSSYTENSVTLVWEGTGSYSLTVDGDITDVTGVFTYTVDNLAQGEHTFYLTEQTTGRNSVTIKIDLQ